MECAQEAIGGRVRAGVVLAGQDDGELIAAESREQVTGADSRGQARSDRHQQAGRRLMTQTVIGVLAAVEVRERNRGPTAPGAEPPFQAVEDMVRFASPVRPLDERFVLGETRRRRGRTRWMGRPHLAHARGRGHSRVPAGARDSHGYATHCESR